MTLLEALASGVPSVCTTSCGIASTLETSQAALVIEPNERDLVESLNQLIVDRELRERLTVAASTTAQRQFSMTAVVDQLVLAYNHSKDVPPKPGNDQILWVTNIPTPYRTPLWAALSAQGNLTVAFMADSEPNRNWIIDLANQPFAILSLNAKVLAHTADSAIYSLSCRLLRHILKNRPHVVVLDGWESPAFMATRLLAKGLGVPVIASYRSTKTTHRYTKGLVPIVRRWFFHGCDRILTAGPASTDAVLEMGVHKDRIIEGFNTVDVERFQEAAGQIRRSLTPTPGHKYLYVGQLIDRKNIASLIKAFHAIREPQDSLTIVGTGLLEQDLRDLVGQLDIHSQVRFRGHLDAEALIHEYAHSQTFVLPSSSEVWGLVVNEALAAGNHAVISDRCGVADSLGEMPGVFISKHDACSLAQALASSRQTWRGSIADHPVTQQTPSKLASLLLDAIPRRTGLEL